MERGEENKENGEVKKMEEGKKMVKKGCFSVTILISIASIISLDFIAGFVGLEAENAQQSVKHNRVVLLECKAPSQTAFWLGIIALSCLVAAHIIAMLIGCSITNVMKASTSLITGKIYVACLAFTWLVGFVGGGFLGMGIWTNRESRSKCGFTNKLDLSWGAKLCFLHAFASVLLHISTIVAKKSCCCL